MDDSTTLRPPPLTEPVPIFETFCTGVAEVADLGSVVRVTCYVDRPLAGTKESERAVVARLVLSADAATALARKLAVTEAQQAFPLSPL